MALPSFIRATGEAGVYEVEGIGQKIRLVEYKVGGVKDGVVIGGSATNANPANGVITAGLKKYLFRDVTGKNKQFNTFENNAGKLPAHTDLIINRVGVHMAQAAGDNLAVDSDLIKLAHCGTLEVFVNKDRQIAEGALYEFPTGYGMTGSTTRNGTGVVTNGVPSSAAAPSLLVAQPVGPNDSVSGFIEFPDNANVINSTTSLPTVSSPIVFVCHLDGLIKRPSGR